MSTAWKIGRGRFDDAITEMRAQLKGDSSDLATLEMIATCHHWAGRSNDAILASREALKYNHNSFDMHALLAQLLAKRGETDQAAFHARRGLECYPEPLPDMPRALVAPFHAVSWLFPMFRVSNPNEALRSVRAEHVEWFEWAKAYLRWYDTTHGSKLAPPNN